jgi:hypothetical protein
MILTKMESEKSGVFLANEKKRAKEKCKEMETVIEKSLVVDPSERFSARQLLDILSTENSSLLQENGLTYLHKFILGTFTKSN